MSNSNSSNGNERKLTGEEVMEHIVRTGKARRIDLEWLRATEVPDADADEMIVDTLIALAAKMTHSPQHMHRTLSEAQWLATNALGVEGHVVNLVQQLASERPDIEMRRVLIAKMVKLRGAIVDFVEEDDPALKDDPIARARLVIGFVQRRLRLDMTGVLYELIRAVMFQCCQNTDPEHTMDVCIAELQRLKAELPESLKAPKTPAPESKL